MSNEIVRSVMRGQINVYGHAFYADALIGLEGARVFVTYDDDNNSTIKVHNEDGEFVAEAKRVMPRPAAVSAGVSFTLSGENSTNYDTFASGTWQLVSASGDLPNTLSSLTTVSASGGEFDKIDTTLLADTVKSSVPGMASAIEYSLESVWDVADAGLIAANAASKIQQQRAFKIKFKNGQFVVFAGTIGAELIPGGSQGGMVTTKLSITANGGQKAYAS